MPVTNSKRVMAPVLFFLYEENCAHCASGNNLIKAKRATY